MEKRRRRRAACGRCWRSAHVSRHLPPNGEGCLLPTPALCLRVFFLFFFPSHGNTLGSGSRQAGSAGELLCLKAALHRWQRRSCWINTPASGPVVWTPRGMSQTSSWVSEWERALSLTVEANAPSWPPTRRSPPRLPTPTPPIPMSVSLPRTEIKTKVL